MDDKVSRSEIAALVKWAGMELSEAQFDQLCEAYPHAQRMIDLGLGFQGSLKVITDAKVISHNANKVKDGEGRKKTYIWVITSPFDPSPKLSFNLR